MLKVKNEKGKFDILLNEATLSNAGSKDLALKRKQNSKVYSSKTPQLWSSHGKTGRKQVTVVNQRQKNDNTKSVQMGHQRDRNGDVLMGEKTPSTKKGSATEDASYLTKEQLSRILSSISGHDLPASQKVSMKSETHEPVQQSFTVNSQSTDSPLVSGIKTSTVVATSPEQGSLPEKSLQWKKDLDEQVALKQKLKIRQDEVNEMNEIEEYNPWGHPGGGTPIRSHSGKVVADYKKMAKNDVDAGSGQTFNSKEPAVKTTGQASNAHYAAAAGTVVPAAMRSSFAVGAPGIVKYETKQSKAEEKKKWLQELEQQIREKKEREAREKLKQSLKESKYETWYQRPSPPVHESSASINVPTSSTFTEQHSPVQTSFAPSSNERAGNVHARGHGLQSLGQVDQVELERKRIKTLEHQLAIKEQVEEKRRLKEEEKERRMKEEAEKERTLAQERERLHKQYQEELKMRHKKEEEARRRSEALQLSITQAHQSAQQEKAAKRMKHLDSGGHDVSGLRSRMEGDNDTSVGLRSTESSSYVIDYSQLSPRIERTESEVQKEDGRDSSWQKNIPLECELKELILSTSLDSRWTSFPVSSRKNNSQANSHLESSRQSKNSTRSQSEKSQRKKQPTKHPIRKRKSLENVTQEEGAASALEDGFMLPYRRTSSATFAVTLDTPTLSDHDTTATSTTNTSKQKVKKADQASQRKTKNVIKRKEQAKGSEITKNQRDISSKNFSISLVAERRKVKQDKAKIADEKLVLDPGKISPEPLPTARQEMILQQLAALRQGLMMKERELNCSSP